MKIYTENFTIILNKHITNTEIDTYEFRVLCYLLMLSDDDGVCFPSYNTIAEKIGIGETKAKNAIKHLIELGIIKKTNRTKEDGSTGSNLYVVCENTTMQVVEKPVREVDLPSYMSISSKLYALAPSIVEKVGKKFFTKK